MLLKNPSALYTLLGLPLFLLLTFLRERARRKMRRSFATASLWPHLFLLSSRRLLFLRLLFLSLSWIALTLALMDPQKVSSENRSPPSPLQQPTEQTSSSLQWIRKKAPHELLFLLDVSASMAVADTRTKVSRLHYARELIQEIVSHLRGEQVALYTFTSKTLLQVPSTMDTLFFRLMLRKVRINQGEVAGTDLLQAFHFLKKEHPPDREGKGRVTAILLTDGGDTYLESLEGEKKEEQYRVITSQMTQFASSPQRRFFCIGLGSAQGEWIPDISFKGKPVRSTLDETLLRQLSQAGHGVYFLANEIPLVPLAREIADKVLSSIDEEWIEEEENLAHLSTEKSALHIEARYYQIPLTLALLFLLLFLFLPISLEKKKSIFN